jgi:cell wall assembly regulator SMI1
VEAIVADDHKIYMEDIMSDITWKYVKKLTNDNAVEEFERKNQISFPEDLKQCIKMHNGGRPSRNIFDTDKTKERMFKTLLSFNNNDVENIDKYFHVIQTKLKNLLPFASDPGGNFLCIQNNKVVLYLHDTGNIEKVADSFSEFLKNLYD